MTAPESTYTRVTFHGTPDALRSVNLYSSDMTSFTIDLPGDLTQFAGLALSVGTPERDDHHLIRLARQTSTWHPPGQIVGHIHVELDEALIPSPSDLKLLESMISRAGFSMSRSELDDGTISVTIEQQAIDLKHNAGYAGFAAEFLFSSGGRLLAIGGSE